LETLDCIYENREKLLGYHSHWFHDWDKLILFIFFPFLGERIINQFHQRINKHHPTYTTGKDWIKQLKSPREIDWVEAVIDWECARITKPDKPLNARQTLEKYYPQYKEFVEPILKELDL
jgi:hypothetical protein